MSWLEFVALAGIAGSLWTAAWLLSPWNRWKTGLEYAHWLEKIGAIIIGLAGSFVLVGLLMGSMMWIFYRHWVM